jgi:glutamine amidotransferase
MLGFVPQPNLRLELCRRYQNSFFNKQDDRGIMTIQTTNQVAIVDYGMGNLRSVEKGCLKAGISPVITSEPKTIQRAKAIILPGVGAFRDCMRELTRLKLIDVIIQSIHEGKPYLGICLGLQILFTESEEFGLYKGLDIIKGRVTRFSNPQLKVPHMGWNRVKYVKPHPLLEGIDDNSFFYFVHSFYVMPEDDSTTLGVTDYGVTFTSMIQRGNLFASQFHPEKSQKIGLRMLANFGKLVDIG